MGTPSPAIEFGAHYVFNMVDADRAPQILVKWIADSLIDPKTDIFHARRYFENAIPGATTMEIEKLAQAIAENWVQGLRRWHALTAAADGEPAINDLHHQLALWDFLGYGELPFEIVITNQLVASAQLYQIDPRATILGGMVTGHTGFSRASPFGAKSMVSTFPMINDLGGLAIFAPDLDFDRSNATRYAAMILAREIGYMLLHVGITWTQSELRDVSGSAWRYGRTHANPKSHPLPNEQRARNEPRCCEHLVLRSTLGRNRTAIV